MSSATTIRNIEAVQNIYAAFGRGDVPSILERVAENVDWNNERNAAGEVPWNGNFSGRKNLPGFFSFLSQNADFTVFEPREFLHDDRNVAVRLRIEFTLKKNGRKIANDSMHFWTFDDQGLVTAYRHFNDTAAELAAWRG